MEIVDRLVARLAAVLIALLVLTIGVSAGLAFVVAGLYMLLDRSLPAWAAALILGGGLVVVSLTIALLLLRPNRRKAKPVGEAADLLAGERTVELVRDAVRRQPGTALPVAVALGILLGMSAEARRAAADLVAAMTRPPRR